MDDSEINSDDYLSSGEDDSDGYYDFSCDDPDPTPRPSPLVLPPNPSTFQDIYRCYHLCFVGKPNLEGGSQILMPSSALRSLLLLSSGQAEYCPMLFEIRSYRAGGRVSHCGVSEFTADEGLVYLPSWMMENLQLEDGDFVNLKSTVLEKGTYIKLQPHSMDFLNIGDPKSALEECFTNKFFSLTKGDTIRIEYKGKSYSINVVDTKPSNAVNIIHTDCVVDFAPPLDYTEPEKKPKDLLPTKTGEEGGGMGNKNLLMPFSRETRQFDEGTPMDALGRTKLSCAVVDSAPPLDYKEPEKPDCPLPKKTREEGGGSMGKKNLFLPFSGTVRRLDGGTSIDALGRTKPSCAVSIINTDRVVDFARPLDFKEPEKPVRPLPTKTRKEGDEGDMGKKNLFLPFSGTVRRLDSGTPMDALGRRQEKPTAKIGFDKDRNKILKERVDEGSLKKKEQFQAFSGKKYSLID